MDCKIDDKIVAIISCNKNSKSELNEKYIKLENAGGLPENVIISNTENIMGGEKKINIEIIDNFDNIIFCRQSPKGEFEYLTHRQSPEIEFDWISVIKTFFENYKTVGVDKNGYYKWGQIVPESGDFLCIDCGFIESFLQGNIFPVRS